MKQTFFLAAVAAALLSCQSNEAPKVAGAKTIDMNAAKQAIDASNAKFGTAVANGDSATVVSLYHADAQLLPPNGHLSNRTAMGAMAAGAPKMGIKKLELKTDELMEGGDYVVERGTWTMGDGTRNIDNGKFLVVWKQEGGEWKMFRDIWNSDNPPASAVH